MAASKRTVPQLLTIPDAAAALSCCDNHVYRLIAAGELPTVDISQPGSRKPKTRVPETALTAYIEGRMSSPHLARDDAA
jgi:excisionase family DNA binding protein